MAGFSMGGALTIRFADKKLYKFAGIILINPGIEVNPAGTFSLSLVDITKIYLFPRLYLFPCGFDKNVRHKPFIKELEDDPFMYKGEVWAGTFGNIHKYAKSTREEMKDFDYPYLFVMSGNDKTINPFIIIDFDRKVRSTDKTHFFAPKMWHSVFFDKEITELVPEISKWISIHTDYPKK